VGVVLAVVLGSCSSFKLVSQRGGSSDAVSGASAAEEKKDAPAAVESKAPAKENADAVSAATN